MPNVANIAARFTADTFNYTNNVNDAADATHNFAFEANGIRSAVKLMQSDFQKTNISLVKFAAGIWAANRVIKKIIGITKDWSDAASELEEIQQKFNIVFRNSRIEVNEWSEVFAESVNRNATNVKRFAAQLQNTFVPLGFMREESTRLSEALVELAFDIASFNDIPVATVAKDLQSALLGNIRAVRKYGISANETAIASEALRNGWVKEKSEIDAVIKARAINNIIMKATRDAQGDLGRTLHQTANIRREYNDTIQRSKELLGEVVNHAITPARKSLSLFITKLNETAESWLNLSKSLRGETFDTDIAKAITRQEDLIDKQRVYITERQADSRISKGLIDAAESAQRKLLEALGAESHVIEALIDAQGESLDTAKKKLIIMELQLSFLSSQLFMQTSIDSQTAKNTAMEERALRAQEQAQDMIVTRLDILGQLQNKLQGNLRAQQVSNITLVEYNKLQEDSKTIQESIARVINETNGKELQDAINNHIELIKAEEQELKVLKETQALIELRLSDENLDIVNASLESHKNTLSVLKEELDSMAGLRNIMKEILDEHKDTIIAAKLELFLIEQAKIREEARRKAEAFRMSFELKTLDALGKARENAFAALEAAEERFGFKGREEIASLKSALDSILEDGIPLIDGSLDILGLEAKAEDLIAFLDMVKDALDEAEDPWEDFYLNIAGFASDAFSQMASLASAVASRQLKVFQFENEQEKKIRDDAHDAEVKRIESTVSDKFLMNRQLETLEEERAEKEEQINEDLELAKRKMQYDSAVTIWNLKLLAGIASGAQAIISATASGFEIGGLPLAIAQASLATIMTGLQIATITASRPVKNFATGTRDFTVPEGFANDSFRLGLTTGERFSVETPNQQIDSGSGDIANIYIMWNNKVFGHAVQKVVRNRDTIIRMEDIK